jgi:hypothetical protein
MFGEEHVDGTKDHEECEENVEQMPPESLKHAFAYSYKPCGMEKVGVETQ